MGWTLFLLMISEKKKAANVKIRNMTEYFASLMDF